MFDVESDASVFNCCSPFLVCSLIGKPVTDQPTPTIAHDKPAMGGGGGHWLDRTT